MTVGLVPIIPSSVTAASGSASISDYVINFTSTDDLIVNGVFDSTYDVYQITMTSTHSTTASTLLYLQLALAGSAATSTVYNYQRQDVINTNLSGSRLLDQGQWVAGELWTSPSSAVIYIASPAKATQTSFRSQCIQTAVSINDCCGYHETATAYDGFRFTNNGGTTTGRMQVFGLAK